MRIPRRPAPRFVLVPAAAGSLLLGCLGAAPAGAQPSYRSPSPAPSAAREPAGVGTSVARAAARGITFGTCPAVEQMPRSVKCGTVEVPLDYAHPDGERISLTVSRIAATGVPAKAGGKRTKRQGALLFNPGGPGGSGMYFPLLGAYPEWKKLAAAYDFVGWAPRGVGRSAPLSCQDPKEYAKAPDTSPVLPDDAYKRARLARAEAYAKGCAKRSGAKLRHYTSLNNARDLEVLRAALGEQDLNFMGASYGTYLGGLYATLFPGHVRRMVLDSAVNPDPEQIWYRNNLDQSFAFEQRWSDFTDWVARHDDAYHLGTSGTAVRAAYDKVRARLARHPAGGTVGPAQLQAAFLKAAYYDDYWASRAEVLSRLVVGKDDKPLLKLAAPPSAAAAKEDENGTAVYTAVECNDAAWPTDFATWDRDNTRLASVAPFETWDNAWMNLPCASWPVPRRRPLDIGVRPGVLPPTLILAAERDAATPYDGALELRRRLGGAALVTERGAGTHGIAGGANDCVNAAVDTYLLTGRVPADGTLDCAPHKEPKPAKTAEGQDEGRARTALRER
ncbi:alpha/beta hydrolase [Streptomyces sp. CLI2509]|uniref:alpha/beta hydrolase n=2 Tax=unclassified Streptomyces TaxID=2593676 RepID=UPI000BACB917|nr:alpha/beta hydrolase [Streptomyces sp. CLI2509]ASY32258.1 protease [Streptomyces sp. CLI2509]